MILNDENGYAYSISEKSKIGQGGQGAVYKVIGNNKLAIKIMINSTTDAINDQQDSDLILKDKKTYANYAQKIRKIEALNAVNSVEHLAVPVAMLKEPDCGYVMRFMNDMTELQKQMRRTNENLVPIYRKNNSLSKKMRVLANVAKIISELNSHGLVYCDFSPGNIFVSESPDSYEVWLIDLDNLHYSGKANKTIGTPHYRAPEIANETATQNTFESDIYSFALIAYEYLTYSNPFNGSMAQAIEDEDAWDADDSSATDTATSVDEFDKKVEFGEIPYIGENAGNNRVQDSGIPHEYVFTKRLEELFLQMFCKKGRTVPESRPSAIEWYEAFEDACNQVAKCSNHHTHIGQECCWCKLLEAANPHNQFIDRSRYFTVTVEDYIEHVDEAEWDLDVTIPAIKAFNQNKILLGHVINERTDCTIPGYFFDSNVNAKVTIRNTSFELDLSLQKVKPSSIRWEYKTDPKDKCVLLKKEGKPFKVINIHME